MPDKNKSNDEIRYRKDNLCEWIERGVIYKCTDLVHLEACSGLVDIFEKKGGSDSDVKRLRVAIKMKEDEINYKNKNQSIESRVIELFSQGTHSVSEISRAMNISLYKADSIIDSYFKKIKRKNHK